MGYEDDSGNKFEFVKNPDILFSLTPIYKSFTGWKTDITHCRTYEELPDNAKKFLDYIEQFLDRKISGISVGPERSQMIVRSIKDAA